MGDRVRETRGAVLKRHPAEVADGGALPDTPKKLPVEPLKRPIETSDVGAVVAETTPKNPRDVGSKSLGNVDEPSTEDEQKNRDNMQLTALVKKVGTIKTQDLKVCEHNAPVHNATVHRKSIQRDQRDDQITNGACARERRKGNG